MRQRPWPIFALAILQFLTPLAYIAFYAGLYHLSIQSATREMMELNPTLRIIEVFFLPIALGLLILVARRFSYYLVITGCLYQLIRGVLVFIGSNQTDPVLPMMVSNLFCAGAVGYLLLSKARDVYLDSRVRWWERNPRYLVNTPGTLLRVGASPMDAKVRDLANGGACLETSGSGFLMDEKIEIEFKIENAAYRLKCRVAWERPASTGGQLLGVQWDSDSSNASHSQLRRLIRQLKAKRTPTSRPSGSWWDGLLYRFRKGS